MASRIGASNFLIQYSPKKGERKIHGYIHGRGTPAVPLSASLSHAAVRRRILMDRKIISRPGGETLDHVDYVYKGLSKEAVFAAPPKAHIMKAYKCGNDELKQIDPRTSTCERLVLINGERQFIRAALILCLSDYIQIEANDPNKEKLEKFLLQLTSSDSFALAILETRARLEELHASNQWRSHGFLRVGIKLVGGVDSFAGVGGILDKRGNELPALSKQDFLFAWDLEFSPTTSPWLKGPLFSAD